MRFVRSRVAPQHQTRGGSHRLQQLKEERRWRRTAAGGNRPSYCAGKASKQCRNGWPSRVVPMVRLSTLQTVSSLLVLCSLWSNLHTVEVYRQLAARRVVHSQRVLLFWIQGMSFHRQCHVDKLGVTPCGCTSRVNQCSEATLSQAAQQASEGQCGSLAHDRLRFTYPGSQIAPTAASATSGVLSRCPTKTQQGESALTTLTSSIPHPCPTHLVDCNGTGCRSQTGVSQPHLAAGHQSTAWQLEAEMDLDHGKNKLSQRL